MSETTVARSYSEALLEFAVREEDVETYSQRLNEIADLLDTEREFRRFLETPSVEPAEKNQVLREVFGGLVPDNLLRFLFVVIDKRRQHLIPNIASEFSDLVDEHLGRLRVRVIVAEAPESRFKTQIEKRLDRMLSRDVIAHYRIDPRIIGGVIFRVGDKVADGSIRRRLQLLRRRMLEIEAT